MKVWTCEVCGKTEPWSDSWSHYGSIRNDENGIKPVVVCSQACQNSPKAVELIYEYNLVEKSAKDAGRFRNPYR